jgi:hypothetical protein
VRSRFPFSTIHVASSGPLLVLTFVTGVANLVTVAAAKIADDEIKAALLTTAQVIDTHIRKATAKVDAEMDALVIDPVNPHFTPMICPSPSGIPRQGSLPICDGQRSR